MLAPEATKKMDGEDLFLDESDLHAGKVPRSEVPSYVLYGEVYGSPFPDCLHCETIACWPGTVARALTEPAPRPMGP